MAAEHRRRELFPDLVPLRSVRYAPNTFRSAFVAAFFFPFLVGRRGGRVSFRRCTLGGEVRIQEPQLGTARMQPLSPQGPSSRIFWNDKRQKAQRQYLLLSFCLHVYQLNTSGPEVHKGDLLGAVWMQRVVQATFRKHPKRWSGTAPRGPRAKFRVTCITF